MRVKSKSNESSISINADYEVIAISISKNSENQIDYGYYIIDNSRSIGFYDSKKFYVINNDINNNWVFIEKQSSLLICPKEFTMMDDFWIRLSDFDSEAIICFKKIFPNIIIGI